MSVRGLAIGIVALLTAASSGLAHADAAGGETEGGQLVGKVDFANSCAPEVQDDLQRAVAMLHSFWFGTGEKTLPWLNVPPRSDPGCAIADWGIASLLMQNPLAGIGSPPQWAARAQAALDDAHRTGAKTQRESDYIEAVAAYYKDFAQHTDRERQAARAKAYEALAARYPDDDEAQIFSALYIAGTQSMADQSYNRQLCEYRPQAITAKAEFAKHPDHPGVAQLSDPCLRRAPPREGRIVRRDVLRRPSSRRGSRAAHALAHLHPRRRLEAVGGHQCALLQGRGAGRRKQRGVSRERLHGVRGPATWPRRSGGGRGPGRDAGDRFAACSGCHPVRKGRDARADGAGAQRLEGSRISGAATEWHAPTPKRSPGSLRAIGAARSGDPATAEQAAAELTARQRALEAANNTYWASEVENQARTAAAWAAFARHDTDRALTLMREAADREDKIEKNIVTPGRLLPARELLADMLLEAGQPGAALREYQASQTRDPNRFRGYYGAARAADAVGDHAAARAAYDKLLDLTKDADTVRPELVAAKAAAGQ